MTMKAITFYTIIFIYSVHRVCYNKFHMKNLTLNSDKINGSGILESPCYANSKIEGRFYIGAYTFISNLSKIRNCFIGRFSRIEENCLIGLNKEKKGSFSNHFFNYAENGPFINDEYYQSIKPNRFFYEKDKITLIGNDVLIHKGVTVYSGVSIGDGSVIYPNSVVEEDIPDYAIVAGIPAQVIGYRFSVEKINLLLSIKWWDFYLSSLMINKKTNLINNSNFILQIAESRLPEKKYDSYYFNDFNKQLSEIKRENIIVGPSHVYLWQKEISKGHLFHRNYFLLGIPGASSYSINLKKTIIWLSKIFRMVYFFVPDFRIGNATLIDNEQDGVFIDPNFMNGDNDRLCYQKGIKCLDELTDINNLKYIFWCLSGREMLNKKSNKFICEGEYKHPIWNLNELKEKYKSRMIPVEELGIDILQHTLNDGTIHPNGEGISLLHTYFNKPVTKK